jgi:opacity protein-like surface antigen
MRLIAAAGLAGACLATTPLYAADLFGSAPPPMMEPMQQEELGSNWYIRGDVGYGTITQASVVPEAGLLQPDRSAGFFDPNTLAWTQMFASNGAPATFNDPPIGNPSSPVPVTRGNQQTKPTPTFDIGVGYRVNDWLRVEGTYSFFRGPGFGMQATKICPEVANAVSQTVVTTDASGNPVSTTNPVGYLWSPNPCTGDLNVTQYNHLGIASAYVDLGHWWMGITPYIGGGVGLNVNTISGSLTYKQNDNGQTYPGMSVNGSAPPVWVVQSGVDASGNPQYAAVQDPNGRYPGIGFGPQSWERRILSTKYTIAGQIAAGIGMPISQSAMLDLSYKATTTDVFGGVKGLLQTVNLGVRYNIN